MGKVNLDDVFYYRKEGREYYFQDDTLVRRVDDKIIPIYTFNPVEDDLQNTKYQIVTLVEFDNHVVVLLEWRIKHNILSISKISNKVIWRVSDPKTIWENKDGMWVRIQKEGDPNLIYCFSNMKYAAAFEVDTGKMTWERISKSPDPRDF
jgi:hypothetical protein